MNKIPLKITLLISLIIAILLSLSPIFILLDHCNWVEILDKFLLLSTAFIVTFLNLIYQNKLQSKKYAIPKTILYVMLFNCILFIANGLIRIPVWNLIPFFKPPITFLLFTDFVRQIIIATVAYFVIFFSLKNEAQVANKIKLSEL